MATLISRTDAVSESRPAPTLKADVNVMLEAARDELPAIQRLRSRFESLAGLREAPDVRHGRHPGRTYAACTPVREGDDPGRERRRATARARHSPGRSGREPGQDDPDPAGPQQRPEQDRAAEADRDDPEAEP